MEPCEFWSKRLAENVEELHLILEELKKVKKPILVEMNGSFIPTNSWTAYICMRLWELHDFDLDQ